jgi:hypothetical protein
MLFAATLLAFVMSFTEGINPFPERWQGPPDEHGHRSAARYYLDHWLPPKVGDPASLDSYSRDYGYSYLNEPDPVYFLAGKFARTLSPVIANTERGFRLFNVALLGILALLCWRHPVAWPVFVPLVVTPQVWYIFSYFNGDGLPLFLSILVAWQIADRESAFNRFLDAPLGLRHIGGALLMAVLVALLVISKKNYYAFLGFIPAALALARLGAPAALLLAAGAIGGAIVYLKWWSPGNVVVGVVAATIGVALLGFVFRDPVTRGSRAKVLVKLAALASVALALAFSRHALDEWIQGSTEQKLAAQGELQEKIAKPDYKPSQIYHGKKADDTYYGIGLRARGTPLKDLFNPFWNWHNRTFASATGSYGWLTFNAPFAYYALMAGAYAALFGLYAWTVVRSRDAAAISGFAIVCAFAALTLAVAIHHSWENDFQAQGRYLFPVAGMAGIGLMAARRWLSTSFTAVVAACFLLSVYSFVFIGLWQVQKSF